MKIKLLLLLLIVCLSATAQKVDLDRFHFTVQYRSYPYKLLNKEYTTYSIEFTGSTIAKKSMMDDELNRSIFLHGWKKVERNGHIIIRPMLGDFVVRSSFVEERKEDIKDKDGRITGARFYYWTKVVYNFPISYSVIDYKNNLLNNESITSADKTWTSQEFDTRKEAEEYFNNNRFEIKNKLTRTDMEQAFTTITNSVNSRYGFAPASYYGKLWILNNSKHPEYEATQNIWNVFKDVSTRVGYETVSESDKTKLLNVVAYFDGLKKKYSSSSQEDKKMRYCAFFNNAVIYTWFLDDCDAAIKEAQGLIDNGFDSGDVKDLKKEAEKIKEDLQTRSYTNSLHYIIDVRDAKAPQ